MTYDESKLNKWLKPWIVFKEENIVKPEDAYLKYTENSYEIVPEKQEVSLLRSRLCWM